MATSSGISVCDLCHHPVDLSDDNVFLMKCGHAIHLQCLPCAQCQSREVLYAGSQIPAWANVGSRWTFPRHEGVQRAMATWIKLEKTIPALDEPDHDPKPWVPLPALQPQLLTDVLDGIPLPEHPDPDLNELP